MIKQTGCPVCFFTRQQPQPQPPLLLPQPQPLPKIPSLLNSTSSRMMMSQVQQLEPNSVLLQDMVLSPFCG